MSYIHTFLVHAAAVQEAARPLGIEACVQLSDYSLRLTRGEQTYVWRPKFIAKVGDRLVYTETRGPGVSGFAGWMPYPLRQWPIATDKIAFKRFALANDIPTPPACFDPALIGGPFIIKKSSSSFGEGMRGPFLHYDAQDPAQQLADGEYYENFIVGHIAKAWCWGDQCVALHLDAPSIVVGDGRSTLRELVQKLPNASGDHEWDLVARLAAYCGVDSLTEVLQAGKEVLVEYRYGSKYEEPASGNPNVLPWLAATKVGEQLAEAARKGEGGISVPSEYGPSGYTLDAILDGEGTLWFLEMNCNPLIHPDMYSAAVATLSGSEDSVRIVMAHGFKPGTDRH